MRKHRFLMVIVILFSILVNVSQLTGVEQRSDEYYRKVRENIDLFRDIFREVSTRYVDDIDPEQFIRAGINGMLETLDPYTVFIAEDDTEDLRIMTSGKYGGVGIVIGLTGEDKKLTVISPIEGTPAERLGIRAGDIITHIDSISTDGFDTRKAATFMRGEPGTDVTITIQRAGVQEPLEYVIKRERITVKDVTAFTVIDDGVGYIRISRFSRKAGDEVAEAVKELKKQNIKGLIIDLRGNPGGLLESAVEVTEKFVPPGETIVSTRGMLSEVNRVIQSQQGQRIFEAPVVALVDEGSASASEIVAGALQDLDRGVIIGCQTFGKGLVQSLVPFNNGTELKITTAKYYTPSGRLIQKADYFAKDNPVILRDETFKEESGETGKYYTKTGRQVLGGGGISPDITIKRVELSPLAATLYRKQMLFNFATEYLTDSTPEQALNDLRLLDKFKQYLDEQKFDYKIEGQAEIEALQEIAREKELGAEFSAQLEVLKSAIDKMKGEEFLAEKENIEIYLRMEFAYRLSGAEGRVKESISGDIQIQEAIKVVKDKVWYEGVLSGNIKAGE